jgi:lipopolysaccharide transport system ATP-binding protein
VSHNMGIVRSLCSRCLYLKAGRVVAEGETETIIEGYEQDQVSNGRDGLFRQPPDERYALQVLEAELCDAHGERLTSAIDQFSPLNFRIRYVVRKPLVGCNICAILTYRGTRLFLTFDTDLETDLHKKRNPGEYEAMIPLPAEMLKAGSYTVGLGSGITNDEASRAHHQNFENLLTFEVRESVDTSLKAYSQERTGIIAFRSNWNTRPLARCQ